MFCHLHNHTTYSVLDGIGLAEDYAKRAKELGYKYLACTDHGNIDGLITFQKACAKYGVTPILGCEGYLIESSDSKKKSGHICLWVKNSLGFKNLCSMLSNANTDNFYYRPLITFEDLINNCKGLVVGTACLKSFVTLDNGIQMFSELKKQLAGDIYIEVMPHRMKDQYDHNYKMMLMASRTKTKVIATYDCHYVYPNQAKYQEMALAVNRKAKWNDPNRWRFDLDDLYLLSKEEMLARWPIRIHLANTIEVAAKCEDFQIRKRNIKLPAIPNMPSEEDILLRLCKEGFYKKFRTSIESDPVYYNRLLEEYSIIKDKGFGNYLLIVWELCNFCKGNNILISTRGSVGGCLMAYLLDISTIDPLEHNLLFDRFINRERVDYPDIDIDIESDKQPLVKKHLSDIYGANKIAGVSNFNKMGISAIRDVARAFDVPLSEVSDFTEAMPSDPDMDSNEALEIALNTSEGITFNRKYPHVVEYASGLLNQIRGHSQHAAAVIIAPVDIAKFGRCNLVRGKKELKINWDKYDAEHVGLVKLDILGLNQLNIFSHALRLIKEDTGEDIDLAHIDLEDKAVLEDINNGYNIGVFQLNTYASTKLLEEMQIKSFRHVVHAMALVRPGPNNMIEEYVRRQRTNRWDRLNDVYEELTSDTYGLLLFQEQIMLVINRIAGLPYSTADNIRRIISKKRNQAEFLEYEKLFKDGCRSTKLFTPSEADHFWDNLQNWARYGFNKCISGDMLLEVRINGSKYKLNIRKLFEIFDGKTSIDILQKNGRTTSFNRVVGIYPNGIKDVFKVTTSGRNFIKATSNHRLLTGERYKLVSEIKPGIDYLAVKSRTSDKISYELVKSVIYQCREEVFDIEMEGPEHNFIANRVVSHNSHSVGYSLLAYQCAYLKHYFPTQFISGALTFGAKEKKSYLVDEAYRLGVNIELPKVGLSDASKWKAKKNDSTTLMIPFEEISTFGPANAKIAAQKPSHAKSRGLLKFVEDKNLITTHNGKIGEILTLINAYSDSETEITSEIADLFDFAIRPRLKKIFNYIDPTRREDLTSILSGNMKVIAKYFNGKASLVNANAKDKTYIGLSCSKCWLGSECRAPISCEIGKYNIMILAEAPGRNEDILAQPLVGKSGDLLWNTLSEDRKLFCVNNVVKCYPAITKTPTQVNIDVCTSNYLDRDMEAIKPILVLAMGSKVLLALEGKERGIQQLSGKITWNDKHGCLVAWCIHPASVLRDNTKLPLFEKSIYNFERLLKIVTNFNNAL